MSDNRVTIKNRVSGKTLVGFWFLVLFAPALLLNLCLEALFDFTQRRNSHFHRNGLINEMEMYRRSIEIEAVVQRISSDFLTQNQSRLTGLGAAQIASEFGRKFNFVPDAVLINSPATRNNNNFYLSDTFKRRAGLVGRAFLKKYMQSRHLHKRLQDKAFLQKDSEEQLKIEGQIKKQILDSDLFFQRQFGLIAALPLLPGHAVSSISSKMKARLIFYFHHPGYDQADVLLIFRASKIGAAEIFKNSLQANDNKMIRAVVRRTVPVNDRNRVASDKLTFFYANEKGMHLVSTLPQTLVSHIVQAGRFFPLFLEDFCRRMPLLRVTIPSKFLDHPLEKYAPVLYFCSQLLCLSGLVFCLRVYLFGFNFRASIRFKAITGIVLITWVPFIMMIAAYFTWRDIEARNSMLATNESLARLANDIQLKFDAFLLEQQRETLRMAEKTENFLHQPESDLISWLNDNLKKTLAREAFLFRSDQERIAVVNSDAFYTWSNDRDENFFLRILAGLLLQAATFDRNVAQTFVGNYEDQGLYRPEPKLVNVILNNRGRLQSFKAFNGDYVYAAAPISGGRDESSFALLCLRFDKRKLIEKFCKDFSPADLFHDQSLSAKTQIKFFAYREELGKFDFFPMDGKNTEIELTDALKIVAASRRSASFVRNDQQTFLSFIPDYPIIFVCRANSSAKEAIGKSIILSVSYVILLLILIYRLFGRFYLMPVSLLVQAARRVGKGDYSRELEIPQGDEFFRVKQSFDQMKQGVVHKQKLFDFVSDDVIVAVKSEEEQALSPGGEKLEAAVVFIALKEFKKQLDFAQEKELLSQLEEFIYQGDLLTRKFGGILDKVIEDTLMLVFRKGDNCENIVMSACSTALELRKCLSEKAIQICAGIAVGEIVSGKIGAKEGKLDYTVIGDAVNLASRLKSRAHLLEGSPIIVSNDTIEKANASLKTRYVDQVKLKGKVHEYKIYELLGLTAKEALE